MGEGIIPGSNFDECIFSVFAHAQLLGTDKFFEIFLLVAECILERSAIIDGMVGVADLQVIGGIGAMDESLHDIG